MESLFDETRAYVTGRIASLLEAGENKLPTDHELAAEITASYATLRLVMKELEQQGFIRRIRGSGTYLTAQAATLLADSRRRRLHIYAPGFPQAPDATTVRCCWKPFGIRPKPATGKANSRWCGATANSSSGSTGNCPAPTR